MASEPVDLQALPLEMARQVFPPMWAVYERPADYPTGYVVRLWWGMTPEPKAHRCATLLQARLFIRDAGGCVQFARQQGDEPQILETWL
jgi:hypothetical protein